MIYHDYQAYLQAIKNGERGIKFEQLPRDTNGVVWSKPFSAVHDLNESIRNGAA